eukprot:4365736-Pyramimonas_sp.AAC.1
MIAATRRRIGAQLKETNDSVIGRRRPWRTNGGPWAIDPRLLRRGLPASARSPANYDENCAPASTIRRKTQWVQAPSATMPMKMARVRAQDVATRGIHEGFAFRAPGSSRPAPA